MDSLKVLDPEGPIREADIERLSKTLIDFGVCSLKQRRRIPQPKTDRTTAGVGLALPNTRSTSSRPVTECIHQQGKCWRGLAAARIVQVIAGERRGPNLKHPGRMSSGYPALAWLSGSAFSDFFRPQF